MPEKKSSPARLLRGYRLPTTGQFVLLGVGLVAAIALFVFLRGFVTCWRLTSLPGMPPSTCPGNSAPPATNDQGTPIAGTPGATTATPDASIPQAAFPPPWDGASRVSILVMGYDYGEWASDRHCPCRSDSMIVLTIDPTTNSAAMVSVPRDMWVNIPGFGYNKINAANFLGDSYKLPGGGPELARKTVEDFLGVPIQYYVMIDFYSFITIVDDIGGTGGICLVIPEDITIDPLGQHNTEQLVKGPDCLNGGEVLAYARARHTANDDIDRSGRQQQVIMAIRDKLLKPGVFLSLVPKANGIYNEVSSGIKTNFPSPDDAIRLASLVLQRVPTDKIQQDVIDYTMMSPGQITLDDGTVQDILRPFPDKIRDLVSKVFGTGAAGPMATSDPTKLSLADAQPLMQQEGASVIVVNASGVDGIGSKTADYLKSQGMNVTQVGNTSDFPDSYASPPLPGKTMLIVHAGSPYAIQYLKQLMGIENIVVKFDPNAPADLVLAVGGDWASSNQMP